LNVIFFSINKKIVIKFSLLDKSKTLEENLKLAEELAEEFCKKMSEAVITTKEKIKEVNVSLIYCSCQSQYHV